MASERGYGGYNDPPYADPTFGEGVSGATRAPQSSHIDVTDPASTSVSDLVGQVGRDLSTLMRQELELAKAEAKDEAKRVGKAGGMFGGAGFAGYMVALFLTVTIMWALALAIPLWASALIVTVLWGAIGAVLAMAGRAELKRVRGLPRTKETLKEDAQWARHPTS